MSKFTHLDAFLLLCSIFTYIVDVALGEHTNMMSKVLLRKGIWHRKGTQKAAMLMLTNHFVIKLVHV